MGKSYSWNFTLDGVNHHLSATLKNNRYILYLDEEHLVNVYRLPPQKMRYGLEETISILGHACLFIVWEDIPDLVIDGKMVHRGVNYAKAKEARRHNMEVMYTATAIFGLVALAGAFVFACFDILNEDNLRIFSALLSAGIWMVGHGLWMRGKWVEQIPGRG